jgi:spore coat protein U-like protein
MSGLRCLSQAVAATALAAAAATAWGQGTTSSPIQVRIDIQGSCLIASVQDIDFGSQLAAASTHTQTGTIQVQCTNGLPFNLGLDGGTVTGDVAARAMESGAGTRIPYSLRRDSPTGTNWGNTAPSWHTGTGLGLGAAYNIPLTVYAEATVAGTEPVGTYLDTVTATITY